MGKRSNFERIPQDKYMTTDLGPVRRLQPFLKPHTTFCEPCAGNGDIIKQMKWYGHNCAYACDTHPGGTAFHRLSNPIYKRDAMTLDKKWKLSSGATTTMFVTNLPWSRDILHPLIDHLSKLLPLWTLCDANWMHTKQAAPYIERCSVIVSVGRVKWIKNSDGGGVDDSCWYFFPGYERGRPYKGNPVFFGLT